MADSMIVLVLDWIAIQIAEFISPVVAVGGFHGLADQWIKMALVSLLLALMLLLGLKAFSNQQEMKALKGRIGALFLEMQLFRHSPAMNLRTIGRILTTVLLQLKFWIVPSLFLTVPVLLSIAVAHQFFDRRPIDPAEPLLVKAVFDSSIIDNIESVPLVLRSSPNDLIVETDPFYSPSEAAVLWRVKSVTSRGTSELLLTSGTADSASTISIPVVTHTGTPVKLTNVKNFVHSPMHSGPTQSPKRIEINYPVREWQVASHHFSWLTVLFVATLVWMLLLKRPMKLEF